VRALITGAGGFCGKHLQTYLRQQQVEICTLGRRTTSDNHFCADMTDVGALAEILKSSDPDYVFHLQGVSHTPDISLFYRVNTACAAALLQALDLAGKSEIPVLLVGTSAEYGRVAADELPITEELQARPYNHYGISKLAQTRMGLACAGTGRPIVVVRPFNIIGEGMPEHLMMKSFARQIAEIAGGRRAPVLEVGNLSPSRDFIDVREAVKLYWLLLRAPAAYGEIVNVCSGREVRVGDVLNRLLEISGVDADIRTEASRLRPDEVLFHYGSVDKLERLTGVAIDSDLDATLRGILNAEMEACDEDSSASKQ
jgi:GDP-4-dehydro-6-deoxy-D-mannose reductase